VKVQSASRVSGVGPAENAGKWLVTYCPGGPRAESASSRDLLWNPGVNRIRCSHCSYRIVTVRPVFPWRSIA
jgi:hypothetical protein